MAVPTRDGSGRISGVLAGALLLGPTRTSRAALDLGFEGLVIIDRRGQQLTDPSFARPANAALLRRMRSRHDEVLPDTRGLMGSAGEVVAYATSAAPAWIVAIDRPSSTVFASARQALLLAWGSTIVAVLIAIALIAWMYRRANRNAALDRERARIASAYSRALADASTPGEVADALAAALVSTFAGTTGIVALELPDEPELKVCASRGPLAAGRGASEALVEPARRAWEAGEPVAATRDTAVRERFPDLVAGAAPIRSTYAVPIAGRGDHRNLGAAALLFRVQYKTSEADRARIAAYVEQAAEVFARTIRQEREHETAVTLQRSLLPDGLSARDGVRLAACYQAGSDGLEVGGDWYDAVQRPDGIIQLSVGDVAGHGIRAATLMAQLRNAFRAYAFEHTSPAEITRRLVRHVPEDEMATTVTISVDPYTQECSYSLAGHPPPLLLDGETGSVVSLTSRGSPPLGFTAAEAIGEETIVLPGQPTLIAYTDGLVERRGTNIDDGIDLLASELPLAAAHGQSVDGIAAQILRAVQERRGPGLDDAAFLILQMEGVPARVELEIVADPGELGSLRRRLRRWLELRGVEEEARIDAVLAIHEACINSIEHGYELGGGAIRITIEHSGDTLEIAVEDEGRWRPPTPDPTRGRGTVIMKATMESATIRHDVNGTRIALRQRLGREPALQG